MGLALRLAIITQLLALAVSASLKHKDSASLTQAVTGGQARNATTTFESFEFNIFHALVHKKTHPPSAGQGSPLLLFLHGAAMMGTNLQDLLTSKASGYPPKLLTDGSARGEVPPELDSAFTLVAPQTNSGWSSEDISALLDALLAPTSGLNLDPNRLYMVGHSMGAAGALEAAAATRRFGAVAAIAPPSAPSAEQLLGTPVWCFHAKNDAVASYSVSETLIQNLLDAGATKDQAKLTLYESAPPAFGMSSRMGHGSYYEALMTPELYSWLLQHSKQA